MSLVGGSPLIESTGAWLKKKKKSTTYCHHRFQSSNRRSSNSDKSCWLPIWFSSRILSFWTRDQGEESSLSLLFLGPHSGSRLVYDVVGIGWGRVYAFIRERQCWAELTWEVREKCKAWRNQKALRLQERKNAQPRSNHF